MRPRRDENRGLPLEAALDIGLEMIGKALDEWAWRSGVRPHFIEPRKPMQKAFVEGFNGRVRDECLNEHWFRDLDDAREIIEARRIDYNTGRPVQPWATPRRRSSSSSL